MSTSSNVTAAKPKIGGGVYSAPLGTTLPTDATTALNASFKNLGYISSDGVKNSDKRSTDDIKAWGGDTVNTVQKEKKDTFKYTLIEALNLDVLKEVYGASNVSGNLNTGITITSNSSELPAHSIVIETVLTDGALKRIVLPNAKVTDVGDVTYDDSKNMAYDTTVTCYPDAQGNTHYEYIVRKAVTNVAS